jgi:hypothetical protein
MELYVNGELRKAEARERDARASFGRIQKDGKGEIQVRDGKRELLIGYLEEFLLLDITTCGTVSHGTLVEPHQVMDALRIFFAGGYEVPVGTKIPLDADGFIAVISGNGAHPDCPLCGMVGRKSRSEVSA